MFSLWDKFCFDCCTVKHSFPASGKIRGLRMYVQDLIGAYCGIDPCSLNILEESFINKLNCSLRNSNFQNWPY